MSVRRVYSEKKKDYAIRAKELVGELSSYLGLKNIEDIRVLVRYDIENISDETFKKAETVVFSEPPVDDIYEETFPVHDGETVFSVEYLPGQFDQRADSAVQCVKLLSEKEEPVIKSATTYVIKGALSADDITKIEEYVVNPVDSRIASEEKPESLNTVYPEPEDIKVLNGFINMNDGEMKKLYTSLNLAMSYEDFLFIKDYFNGDEHRDPTMTEIRMLDTYWSDHCRHTTFLTELKNVSFSDSAYTEPVKKSWEKYVEAHKEISAGRPDKYISLMDIALAGMKKLKKDGKLTDMEVSDEINACSIVVPVEETFPDGHKETEEWLVFFKNETHNHPTEIEPFGGAATCLGGAIRDPLSGRGYVYQAMRVTGAADPTVSVTETLKGKLPQRKIVTGAARGYSSYGNQIGLSTGLVDEVYHPNYVAKRLEIGAVMGAAKRKNVIRMDSDPGDQIILLGGRTGRDGIGGATGSSKSHTTKSIDTCGAEVQKGNAPTERKIQRLFRRPEVTKIIKKCNDFGAGGVSVAIGELADGLHIYLDRVPKKYAGLDGTEIAISESQERMALVVAPRDVEKMLSFAAEENLEAVVAAEVTRDPRLVMEWRGKEIVNISRKFLNTNGAHVTTEAKVVTPEADYFENGYKKDEKCCSLAKEEWLAMLSDLNACSKRGLSEMFDSSIGASTVLMPFGGRYEETPNQTMAAKIPMDGCTSDACTLMSYGFDPYISTWSPYHGAVYSVLSSASKIVAAGGDPEKIHFTFQEYFGHPGNDSEKWGKPLAALLGAFEAQMQLGLASIGGKDSMSGTFNDIDVPPTLVSFAVDVADTHRVISDEFKKAGNKIYLITSKLDRFDLPLYDDYRNMLGKVRDLIKKGDIVSAYVPGRFGVAEAVSKMAFGNHFGVKMAGSFPEERYFAPVFAGFVAEVPVEMEKEVTSAGLLAELVGEVTDDETFTLKSGSFSTKEALNVWRSKLEGVYPTRSISNPERVEEHIYDAKTAYSSKVKIAKPRVFIPVFPGTNCEYDAAKAFVRAGAVSSTVVFRNRNEQDIVDSTADFIKAINDSQIIMFPGGFSAGDEPDGSAKFIASVMRNQGIAEAVERLLDRDGLILGICNGFQALIKLGLVPYGRITDITKDTPTLTTNSIGRHVSRSVYTKCVSNKSPWLQKLTLGGVYTIPASHGEGRFVADDEWLKKLSASGQIAFQYVDVSGNPTMDEDFNPNGSYMAIEGITDPTGHILGKMAHSERIGDRVAINISGSQDEKIFESGVAYFVE